MIHVFYFAGFQADRERYELRTTQCAIKLERIPLEILFLLLENRGKLVPRTQIVAELWGAEVFVDTEHSINTAIHKLREALGDDPHHPKFIGTVVGRGYRFIAPVVSTNDFQVPDLAIPPDASPSENAGSTKKPYEIRLCGFSVETQGNAAVLACDVSVGNLSLGRIALAKIKLPSGVTLPLKLHDRLLIKHRGVRTTITAEALQALESLSRSVLERGLSARATDPQPGRKQPGEATPDISSGTDHLYPQPRSQSA